MCPILKLKRHNEEKEIEFELKYLLSLTTRQRFEMMFKKSKEMKELLEKSGHSQAVPKCHSEALAEESRFYNSLKE